MCVANLPSLGPGADLVVVALVVVEPRDTTDAVVVGIVPIGGCVVKTSVRSVFVGGAVAGASVRRVLTWRDVVT